MRLTISKQKIACLKSELKKAEQLNNLRLYKMVWCLLMISEGKAFNDISNLLGVSSRTVYNWIGLFAVYGFSWLLGYHYQGRGRKPKLNKEQKAKLFKIVEDGPEEYGFDCGIWNSAMIVEVIQKEFCVLYNPRYVCSLLSSIGLSYQKAAFVSDRMDDEEHQKKRKEWVEVTWPQILEKAKTKKAVILFADEVSFAQWGSLSKTWAPKGKQPKIKTCGKRKGLKMFGAIEFSTGTFLYMERDGKFNGESYIEFMKRIIGNYSCPVILIEDGASYHGSKIVTNFKNELNVSEMLDVYRLPAYSPDKNPIEKLWKKTKKDATHCKYFPTFESLRSSVIAAFNKYLEDATKVISTMRKLRAEAGIA